MIIDKLLKEIHEERVLQEKRTRHLKEVHGEKVYTMFKFWCMAFNDNKGQRDENTFAKFMREENVELNFWQKKALLENHFGYIFTFDMENMKWDINKK